MVPEHAAIILAGGAARRLGGRDKPAEPVGGRSLVTRVAAAVPDAVPLIVVGPHYPDLPHAQYVREDPPAAGPIPALRAGLTALPGGEWVAVLAGDLPFLRVEHVRALLAAAAGSAGAVLVDDTGREQWLAGVWRPRALRGALAAYGGSSLGGVFAPLRPALVRLQVAGGPAPWFDCDTPEDLERARRSGI
jgi:molybdopterin-guanine dinucleotide biosynthesis protein A